MERFEIERARCVMGRCSIARQKGDSVVAGQTIDVLLDVDERSSLAMDFLFPGFDHVENEIAARDQTHRGLTIQGYPVSEPLSVKVFDQEDGDPVFEANQVEMVSRPALRISKTGESQAAFRLRPHLAKEDLARFLDYLDADVYLSASISQQVFNYSSSEETEEEEDDDLPFGEETDEEPEQELAPEPPKRKRGRPRKNPVAEPELDPMQRSLIGTDGNELKAIRARTKRSQSSFAELLGELSGSSVSVKSLQRYEMGKRPVPESIIQAMRQVEASLEEAPSVDVH